MSIKSSVKPDFKKKVFPNGMTVLFEKRKVPVVSIGIGVKHGGVHELSNEKGISHFIEHLLYKGTKNRTAKQIAEEIERNGGDLNGFTQEEFTAFWCKMPSKHLDIGLDVLTDMVKNPLFNEKELEKERKVIFEEMKMRRDNPQVCVFDKMLGCLYSSPVGDDLIGTEKTMNSITRDKILKKFEEYYVPQNFVLCIVGDADFDKILKFVEKNFVQDKMYEKRKGKKAKVPEFKLKNESKIEKRKGIDQVNLVIAFHSPLSKDKKHFAQEVLMNLMGNGMSSRLFQEIREKRNLVYNVLGTSDVNGNFAHSFIFAGTGKDKVEEVKKVVFEEFKKASKDISEKELNEIKEQMIGNYLISMESSQVQMVNLLHEEVLGDAKDFYKFEENISEVKLVDVREAAKIGKYSFIVLLPE